MKLKAFVLSGLFIFSAVATAQSDQDMQHMMEKMQQMQSCMAEIDQSEFQAIEQRARKFEAELKSLCSAGKRSAAVTTALAFSQEINSNSTVMKVRECSEGIESMMASMPIPKYDTADMENSGSHVCDGM